MSNGGTFSPPVGPGARRGAMISRDKLPCTRMAAAAASSAAAAAVVVGAQRDRVA